MKKAWLIILLCLTWVSTEAAKKSVLLSDARQQQFLYYYYDAQRAFSEQQYDKAFSELLLCEQIKKDDAATLNALATFYNSAEQHQIAMAYAKRAWEINAGDYWSLYASLLMDQKKRQEAIAAIEKARKQKPQDEEILESLFSLYLKGGETSKALKMLNRLEEVEGVNSYNAIRRYQVYTEAGQVRKAVKYVEDFAAQHQDEMQIQIMWGDLLLSMGRTEEALKHFFMLLEKENDNPYVYRSLAAYYNKQKLYGQADSCYMQMIVSSEWTLGQKLQFINQNQVRLEQSDLTPSFLNELIEQYPLDETVYKSTADYYMQVKRDTITAIGYMETLTTANEKNSAYWETLCNTYRALGDSLSISKLDACIKRTSELFPNDLLWCYYGMLRCLRDKDAEGALKLGHAGLSGEEISNGQYRAAIYALMGDVYAYTEDFQKSFDSYELSLQYEPDNISILNNYAYLLAIQGGDLKKAERMSEKVIQKEATNPIYLDTYAWILYLQGQYSLAKFYIKKAYSSLREISEADEIVVHYNEIMKQP